MEEPRFSILLPTHNRAEVLGYAIRSVLWQTSQSFEVLIVGDGCTDKTADVVQGFRDPRLRWFDLPKAPYFGYANRNVALRQARSRYVAFLGHDNILFPDHLSRLAACLDEHAAEFVYSRPLWVTRQGQIKPAAVNLHDPDTRAIFLSQRNLIPATCVMYRRECHEKYGYWNPDLPQGADWDLWVRFIQGGNHRNFAYEPVPTCLHFTANWRTLEWSLQHVLAMMLLSEADHALPPALKVHIPDGTLEQEAVWAVMSPDPASCVAHLRTAVGQALDRAARSYVPETTAMQSLRDENARLKTVVEELARQANLAGRLRRLIFPPHTRRERLWLRLRPYVRRGATGQVAPR